METPLSAASQIAIATLKERVPEAFELAGSFKAAGFRLALVGGTVRDALLNRLGNDLDFTTDAKPEDSKKILKKFADETWDVGIKFGTIGAKRGETTFEVTTYRADSYEADTRKPEVQFGDNIEDDLRRRDFTVNAMAIELTTDTPEFIDPYNGVTDLLKKILRTPATPEMSFSDDPLRMLRAARFASQLGFAIDEAALKAMGEMKDRLEIVSAERVRDEFIKTVLSDNPRVGINILV